MFIINVKNIAYNRKKMMVGTLISRRINNTIAGVNQTMAGSDGHISYRWPGHVLATYTGAGEPVWASAPLSYTPKNALLLLSKPTKIT